MRWMVLGSTGLGLLFGPGVWSGRDAGRWLSDDPGLVDAHARGVQAWVEADLVPADLGTGSAHFDGEWWFATHSFAAVGHLQAALAHPAHEAAHVAAAEAALAPLLTCEAWRFDARKWGGECALDALGTPHDHAVLGYLALPLSLHRVLRPEGDLARWNDRVVRHLARRLEASPSGLLATYPGEAWPVDTSMAVAAVAVHAHATGVSSAIPAAWSRKVRARFIDADTGLLVQSAAPDGSRRGPPRGSGTTLTTWAMGFADPDLAADLWAATRRELYGSAAGFAAIREVPGDAAPIADIDSGPVLLGQGVSATGFALGAARAVGDDEAFRALYATAHAVGGPVSREDTRGFVVGGPLGDALMFALCTTRPAATWGAR